MSRSRDSLSRALDDRQHRSTLASLVISWVKGTIPFIAMYIYIFSSSHQSRLLFILAVWHHLQHQLILPFFRAWSFYRYFSLSFSLPLFSWQYTRRNIPFNAKPQNFASRRNSCHASHVSPSTHDECLESIRSLPPAINVITFIRTVDNLRLILYLSVSNIAEWFRPIHAQNLFRNFITN